MVPHQRAAPFFPEVHDELTKSWRNPYSARLRTSTSTTLTTIDCAEEKDYEKLLLLDEASVHLCTSIRWKAKVAHPSKPCGNTTALAGRAYTSAGQAGSTLHTLVVLQVFQEKLLRSMDESSPDPAAFKELHTTK